MGCNLAAARDFQGAWRSREDRAEHWTTGEIDEAAFKDARLGRRFGDLIRQIGEGMGESIPYACQDWASTKAAYRFFANERVEEAEILSGHFAATRDRVVRAWGMAHGLVLLMLRGALRGGTEKSMQRYIVGAAMAEFLAASDD